MGDILCLFRFELGRLEDSISRMMVADWLGLRSGWVGLRPGCLGLRPCWMAQRGDVRTDIHTDVQKISPFYKTLSLAQKVKQGGVASTPDLSEQTREIFVKQKLSVHHRY